MELEHAKLEFFVNKMLGIVFLRYSSSPSSSSLQFFFFFLDNRQININIKISNMELKLGKLEFLINFFLGIIDK